MSTATEEQTFQHGDLVKIAENLGESMRHYPADCEAIVIASYAEQFGGNDKNSYTLFLQGHGPVSWYRAHQLTLIEARCLEKLKEWRLEFEIQIQNLKDANAARRAEEGGFASAEDVKKLLDKINWLPTPKAIEQEKASQVTNQTGA